MPPDRNQENRIKIYELLFSFSDNKQTKEWQDQGWK